MTETPAILNLLEPKKPIKEVVEIDTSENDLAQIKAKLDKLKESQQKTKQVIREVLVQLDDLEALERRTLELLLKKLEK